MILLLIEDNERIKKENKEGFILSSFKDEN